MRVQFDGAVPHALLPCSTVLRFLIFLPVHVVHCSCLLFFAFPFVILAVRRGFEGDGEEREGMEAPRHVEPVILQRVGWCVGGPRGGRGDAPLAKTGCTRSPTAVYGSSYLSILLLPPPSLECGGISIILVGNLVWLSSYPLSSPAVSWL